MRIMANFQRQALTYTDVKRSSSVGPSRDQASQMLLHIGYC